MTAALRIVFVLLIGAGVMAQVKRAHHERVPAGARSVAAVKLGLQETADANADHLVFRAPACPAPIEATTVYLDGREAPDPNPRASASYVFLGSVQDHFDAAALRRQWFVARLLFIVGMRTTRPEPEALRVSIPDECSELARLDWASLSP